MSKHGAKQKKVSKWSNVGLTVAPFYLSHLIRGVAAVRKTQDMLYLVSVIAPLCVVTVSDVLV